jgi:hypothetical protein
MKKYILILMFIPYVAFGQTKLYKGFYSKMTKDEVKREIEQSNDIRPLNTVLNELDVTMPFFTHIQGIKFVLFFSFDENDKLTQIGMFTDDRFDSQEYYTNISYIVKEVKYKIILSYGEPEEVHDIPEAKDIAYGEDVTVAIWWDDTKSIELRVESSRHESDRDKPYFVRLQIVDWACLPMIEDKVYESDF